MMMQNRLKNLLTTVAFKMMFPKQLLKRSSENIVIIHPFGGTRVHILSTQCSIMVFDKWMSILSLKWASSFVIYITIYQNYITSNKIACQLIFKSFGDKVCPWKIL